MAKRRPESQLTQSNWDDEIEHDEVGQFQRADAKEMQSRRILAPKRRLPKNDNDSNGCASKTPSVFSNFSLISKPSTTVAESSKMGFSLSAANSQLSSSNMFAIGSATSTLASSVKPTSIETDIKSNTKFETKLSELNNAFLVCIKKHIESGKICILSPIFRDYDKYVDELRSNNENGESNESNEKLVAANTVKSLFSFTNASASNEKTAEKHDAPTVSSATFSFGKPAPASNTQIGSSFSFGSSVQLTSESAKNTNGAENVEDEENDEPPKVEFIPVVEDNIYSKRCKIFVKDDGDYKDRGTGTLYLKNVKDDKVQLLVRADTNLGNILLNILISPGLPVKQLKNNVVLVCIPTPEAEPKPKSVLVRVKTENDATELLEEIQKHQK